MRAIFVRQRYVVAALWLGIPAIQGCRIYAASTPTYLAYVYGVGANVLFVTPVHHFLCAPWPLGAIESLVAKATPVTTPSLGLNDYPQVENVYAWYNSVNVGCKSAWYH